MNIQYSSEYIVLFEESLFLKATFFTFKDLSTRVISGQSETQCWL